jgi:hypothetical protein
MVSVSWARTGIENKEIATKKERTKERLIIIKTSDRQETDKSKTDIHSITTQKSFEDVKKGMNFIYLRDEIKIIDLPEKE